jgi:anti-anti-sigma factor
MDHRIHTADDASANGPSPLAYRYLAAPAARLILWGEIDLAAVPTLDLADLDVAVDASVRLTVDARRVTFIDSTGVAWLLRLHESVDERGATVVVLAGRDGVVARTLRIALGPQAASIGLREE